MKVGLLVPWLALGSARILSAQETVLYSDDFSTADGWTVITGCQPGYAWAVDATPGSHQPAPYVSPPASLNFNDGTDFGDGHQTCGSVRSDPIDLSPALGHPRLRFQASWEMEIGCEWDVLGMRILAASDGAVLLDDPCVNGLLPEGPWHTFDYPLEASWGSVQIEFRFDSVDGWDNGGSGPFIDDVEIVDVTDASSSLLCLGDGSVMSCPCLNSGGAGEGCRNSTGHGGVLTTGGTGSVAIDDLVLSGSQLRPNQFGTYIQGDVGLNGGNGVHFGDGLRCAGGSIVRLQQVASSAAGESSTSIHLAERGGVVPGDTRVYQLWYRDPNLGPCGSNFNLTNGIALTWGP